MTAEKKTIREIDRPRCPICEKKMYVVRYKGYYDERIYWECECFFDDIEPYVEREEKGAYA